MSQRATVPNTEEFVVSKVVGDTTGEEFSGKFTAKKRLSFNDQLRRDQVRRQMLGEGGAAPSARATSMADIFSELMVRLTVAPSWWTDADEGRNLEDENVVVAVFEGALSVEKKAFEEVQKRAEKAKEDLATAASEEPAIK